MLRKDKEIDCIVSDLCSIGVRNWTRVNVNLAFVDRVFG